MSPTVQLSGWSFLQSIYKNNKYVINCELVQYSTHNIWENQVISIKWENNTNLSYNDSNMPWVIFCLLVGTLLPHQSWESVL